MDKQDRAKLVLLATLRVLANGLDLLGLLGIALLATAFGAFASGTGQAARFELPVVGEFVFRELEAVFIAVAVAATFVLKSGFSVWLNLKTSLFIATIESGMSKTIAADYFAIDSSFKNEKASVSDFQTISIESTSGIRIYLNARVTLLAEASLLIAMVAIFLVVNPYATVGLGLFMGGVLVVLNRLINIRMKRNGEAQIAGSRESLEAARDLHGIKREATTSGVVDVWLGKYNSGREKLANSNAITYTLNSLPRFIIETSLILGILLFIGGVVIFSDIPSQAVTIGVFLAGGLRVIASVLPLQTAITSMKEGSARGRTAFEALTRIHESKIGSSGQKSLNAEGQLQFKDVYYSYPGSTEEVLKDVSFEIKPLTKVAIVGPSGAGKSTIFELAMGFREPDAGKVLFGGVPTGEVLQNSPGTFAVVPQRPHLVTGTLLQNISLVSEEETDKDKAKEVLIRAGLKKLTTVPGWEKQDIRPDSGQLSGGEIQRLSLARALYRNPKILFLDEATSALDAETEFEITSVLDKLRFEMTIVLIAHRLSTVKKADKIIYLDKGQIVAEGTFSELKKQVSGFARAIEIMGLSDDE